MVAHGIHVITKLCQIKFNQKNTNNVVDQKYQSFLHHTVKVTRFLNCNSIVVVFL